MLHEQIGLQRATQLVTWAMPMMNFETLYPAMLSNQKMSEDDIFFSLCDGYYGVYPYHDRERHDSLHDRDVRPLEDRVRWCSTSPLARSSAWSTMPGCSPFTEIEGKPGKLLLVGPGQKYPKDFDGKIVQSDTFLVLYFYRALGTGDAAKKLRTSVQAYKLSEAKNPPKTQFIKYDPKPDDKVALNTQPRDIRFWELVNEYVQREPMADRDRFFYAWLKELGIEKGQGLQTVRQAERDDAKSSRCWHGHVAGDLLQQDQRDVPDFSLWQGFRF